jgi:hypothetical protein
VVAAIHTNDKISLAFLRAHVSSSVNCADRGGRDMDVQIKIDDPKAYTKPWTAELHPELIPDTDLLVGEWVSNKTPERIAESLLDSAIRPDNDGNQAAVAPRLVQSRLAELHPPLFITGALGVPLAK